MERNDMDISAQADKLSGARALPVALKLPELPDFSLTPTTVQPGQVWRARWDDALALVFVDSVLGGLEHKLRVAPITIGIDDADDSAILLPATASTLGNPLSVWPSLISDVAEIVLERWIATLGRQFSTVAAIEEAASAGDLRRGLPILNADSERIEDKQLLARIMESLAEATSLIAGSGLLPDLISTANVAVTVLAATLKVDNALALKIRRGEVGVDLPQARALAPLLGKEPIEIVRANPAIPDGLIDAVTSLRRSVQVRALATMRSLSESEAFGEMSRGSLALAARGERGQPDWAGRVDRYLQLALGDGR
jgi:hypothetical protein